MKAPRPQAVRLVLLTLLLGIQLQGQFAIADSASDVRRTTSGSSSGRSKNNAARTPSSSSSGGGSGGDLRIQAIDQDAPPGDVVAVLAGAIPKSDGRVPRSLSPDGVIDAADARRSAVPGLTPLAQAHAPVGAWLRAVDAAGPLTPLSDPRFVGTVFIPEDGLFRALVDAAVGGRSNAASPGAIAGVLNSLAAPGRALRASELRHEAALGPTPLPTAAEADGARASSSSSFCSSRLVVSLLSDGMSAERELGIGFDNATTTTTSSSSTSTPAAPSSLLPVAETDLQVGDAVGHVLARPLAPFDAAAAGLPSAAAAAAAAGTPLRYDSAAAALADPRVNARRFAELVGAAGLSDALGDAHTRATVFAPADAALEALIPPSAWQYLGSLPEGRLLAEALVARHWVSGAALGTPALRARAAAGIGASSVDGRRIGLRIVTGPAAAAGSSTQQAPAHHFVAESAAQIVVGNDTTVISREQQQKQQQQQNKHAEAAAAAAAARNGSGALQAEAALRTPEKKDWDASASAGQRSSDAAPQSTTTAAARARGSGLLVGSRALVAADSGLGRRAAVHVISDVLPDARLPALSGAFLGAAARMGGLQAADAARAAAAAAAAAAAWGHDGGDGPLGGGAAGYGAASGALSAVGIHKAIVAGVATAAALLWL